MISFFAFLRSVGFFASAAEEEEMPDFAAFNRFLTWIRSRIVWRYKLTNWTGVGETYSFRSFGENTFSFHFSQSVEVLSVRSVFDEVIVPFPDFIVLLV